MPLYEYECKGCRHQFEQLIRTGDTPTCPKCQGQELERLLSHVTMSSDQTRQLNFDQAKRRADKVRLDKEVAHQEYVRDHHDH